MDRRLLLIGAIAYTVALTTVSFINLSGVPSLGSSFDDKIYHVAAYVILGGIWITCIKHYSRTKKALLITFVITFLYGIIIEIMQHQLNPNRTYDNYDLLSNCIGVLFGTFIAVRINVFKLK